jgi:hypothetical protein
MTEASPPAKEAENLSSELLALQTKINAARVQGTKFRTITTLALVLVFVVYGFLIYSMVKQFDMDRFLNELHARAVELQPEATSRLQGAIRANQEETVARIDTVIKKHLPAFEDAAERETELLAEDLKVHFVERLELFAQGQVEKHAQDFFTRFPEMEDEQFRGQSLAHLEEVLAMAVQEVMDREFLLIQQDIDMVYGVFTLPQVRTRIEEIKIDPRHRERLMRSFLSIVAEPFAQ